MLKPILKKIVVYIITLEARLVLKKYRPRIIAITGSVGKTSTKDAIYRMLSAREFVRKSEKSFNSDIGVPLTILGRPNAWNDAAKWFSNIVFGLAILLKKQGYPRWLVLEVGADRPGDIESICRWLKPDIVVVTRFAEVPVHVEFFNSKEDLVKEKSFLVKALKPDGMLVLLKDEQDVHEMTHLVSNEAVTYGYSKGSDVLASKVSVNYEGRGASRRAVGSSVKLTFKQETSDIFVMGTVGKQLLYAVMAAAAVGVTLKIRFEEICSSLSGFEGPKGRMKLIPGINHSLIIDDTYNSSPVAAREALSAIEKLEARGRKIAVLGDMLELGKYSVREHKEIGKYASSFISMLITIGVRSRDIAIGALENGMKPENILEFDDSKNAGIELSKHIKQGDVILVKGSQSIRCEKVVEQIMANPEDKFKLLVRQETEWKKK